MKTTIAALAFLLAVPVLGLAACGSGTTTTIIIPIEASTPVTITSDAGDTTTPLSDAGAACASTASDDACSQCCGDQDPAAAKKYVGYILACFCQASTCATQCASTYCAATPTDPATGSACDTCLTAQNDTCGSTVDPQCENDPACLPLIECLSDADCADKP